MRTKEDVLKENGWSEFKGFCFPSPRAEEEQDNTFVAEEDAWLVIKEGVKSYWYTDIEERLYDLDDAWDLFYEHWCNENLSDSQDISFKDWEKTILNVGVKK